MSDLFRSKFGNRKYPWQRRRVAKVFDLLFDVRISREMRNVRKRAKELAPRTILVASVAVPDRSDELHRVFADFRRSHHEVTVCEAPMKDQGKFDNINIALKDFQLEKFDWLIVTDDDVRLPPNFLDDFIYVADKLELKIAQPAHRCRSYVSYPFNHRKWSVLGRVTHFVECGPITAFHRDVFKQVIPFPALRWAWGTDIAWSVAAGREHVAIGIVDCTPVEHLKPVAGNYKYGKAITEAREFLESRHIPADPEQLFVNVSELRSVS